MELIFKSLKSTLTSFFSTHNQFKTNLTSLLKPESQPVLVGEQKVDYGSTSTDEKGSDHTASLLTSHKEEYIVPFLTNYGWEDEFRKTLIEYLNLLAAPLFQHHLKDNPLFLRLENREAFIEEVNDYFESLSDMDVGRLEEYTLKLVESCTQKNVDVMDPNSTEVVVIVARLAYQACARRAGFHTLLFSVCEAEAKKKKFSDAETEQLVKATELGAEERNRLINIKKRESQPGLKPETELKHSEPNRGNHSEKYTPNLTKENATELGKVIEGAQAFNLQDMQFRNKVFQRMVRLNRAVFKNVTRGLADSDDKNKPARSTTQLYADFLSVIVNDSGLLKLILDKMHDKALSAQISSAAFGKNLNKTLHPLFVESLLYGVRPSQLQENTPTDSLASKEQPLEIKKSTLTAPGKLSLLPPPLQSPQSNKQWLLIWRSTLDVRKNIDRYLQSLGNPGQNFAMAFGTYKTYPEFPKVIEEYFQEKADTNLEKFKDYIIKLLENCQQRKIDLRNIDPMKALITPNNTEGIGLVTKIAYACYANTVGWDPNVTADQALVQLKEWEPAYAPQC